MEYPLKIWVVVLAWNHLTDTLECLRSVKNSSISNLNILLVDNGSEDGTHQKVPQEFPEIEVIRLESNIGISRGYNAGIERAMQLNADYVMVLNNDTCVDKEMIEKLVDAIQFNPSAGMAVPKIFYYHDRERIWSAGAGWYWFPPRIKLIGLNERDGPKYEKIKYLEYATSCCLFITRAVFENLGIFDPNYFFYFDDWDLSARIRGSGLNILFVPQAHLWHKVSVSTTKGENPEKYWYMMGRSSVRFYLTHKSLLFLAGYSLWFIFREIIRFKFSRIQPFIYGLKKGYKEFHGIET